MTVQERQDLSRDLLNKALDILENKGRAYAGERDVLLNFKRNAERLGMTRYQIWAVYANKHIDSINNAIADNPAEPVDTTEGLEGRIIDVINYHLILYAMLNEGKE